MTFCPYTILSVYHFVRTILSATILSGHRRGSCLSDLLDCRLNNCTQQHVYPSLPEYVFSTFAEFNKLGVVFANHAVVKLFKLSSSPNSTTVTLFYSNSLHP